MEQVQTALCRHEGCMVKVWAGRGYCGRHGGSDRLRRETVLGRARVVKPVETKKVETKPNDTKPNSAKLNGLKPKPKRFVAWGPAGAPKGMGLSRCAKLDYEERKRKEAAVRGFEAFFRWAMSFADAESEPLAAE